MEESDARRVRCKKGFHRSLQLDDSISEILWFLSQPSVFRKSWSGRQKDNREVTVPLLKVSKLALQLQERLGRQVPQ